MPQIYFHPDTDEECVGMTSPEAIAAAGVTYRQMDYWTRTGRLSPVFANCGIGTSRMWPEAEVEIARRMGRLVNAGLPLEFAARMARTSWPEAEIGDGIRVVAT